MTCERRAIGQGPPSRRCGMIAGCSFQFEGPGEVAFYVGEALTVSRLFRNAQALFEKAPSAGDVIHLQRNLAQSMECFGDFGQPVERSKALQGCVVCRTSAREIAAPACYKSHYR